MIARTPVPAQTWRRRVAVCMLSALLAACAAPPPPAKPLDPAKWTPEGNLRFSAEEEEKAWLEIRESASKAPPWGLAPDPLMRYLRHAPDGPHAAEVRRLLETKVLAPRSAALLKAPDAACRAKVESQFKSLFRLAPSVAVPSDAFVSSPTVVLSSRSGQPAPVEKKVVADLRYNSVTGTCSIVDRYDGIGYGVPACPCAPINADEIGRPQGRHAEVLRSLGTFKAMTEVCGRHGIDLGKQFASYVDVVNKRADGEVRYDTRLQAMGKPQLPSDQYQAKVYALLLADLRRNHFNRESYDGQLATLKDLSATEAPLACEGAKAMMADATFRESYSYLMRRAGGGAAWEEATK